MTTSVAVVNPVKFHSVAEHSTLSTFNASLTIHNAHCLLVAVEVSLSSAPLAGFLSGSFQKMES
jgi:hypothetical protein